MPKVVGGRHCVGEVLLPGEKVGYHSARAARSCGIGRFDTYQELLWHHPLTPKMAGGQPSDNVFA